MVDRWAWLPRLGHSSRTKRETRGRRAKLNIWDVAELGRGGIVVQSLTFGMMPSWGGAGKGLEYSFVDCLAFAVRGLDVRDECFGDRGCGRLHLSYSSRFGGSVKLNLLYFTCL